MATYSNISKLSLGALTCMVSGTAPINATSRTIPHTIIFKNTSDREQTISIESEYTLTRPDTQVGRDCIVRPIAPGRTFTYGGKRYAFSYLEVRLNPVPTTTDGMVIVGLADNVSEVTIFDDDAYTVKNRESFDHKLLKARVRMTAARQATAEKFRKAGTKMRNFWHKTKDKMANLFGRAKKQTQEGKEHAAKVVEHTTEQLAYGSQKAIEGLGYAQERIAQGTAHATEKAAELAQNIKEQFEQGKEQTREGLEHAREWAKEKADQAAEKAGEIAERVKEGAEHAKEQFERGKERAKRHARRHADDDHHDDDETHVNQTSAQLQANAEEPEQTQAAIREQHIKEDSSS